MRRLQLVVMAWTLLLAAPPAARAEAPAVVAEAYRTHLDIGYRDGEDVATAVRDACRLDAYVPTTPGFATVVWFHGGGLVGGSRETPDDLKDRGVAIIGVDYRLAPQVQAPAYIEDAAAAVAWTFRHIHEYGGDADLIFVAGHSAGGYLAAMVGLDKRWLAAHEIDANRLAGVAPYSGHAITHFTVRNERGIPDTRPVIDELAPLYHVRGDASPLLLITGDRNLEMLGRYEENAYLWRMMDVAGARDVNLVELNGRDHGGMVAPGHPLLLRFIERITNASAAD